MRRTRSSGADRSLVTNFCPDPSFLRQSWIRMRHRIIIHYGYAAFLEKNFTRKIKKVEYKNIIEVLSLVFFKNYNVNITPGFGSGSSNSN
jgi:hypothetical protein